MKICENTDCYFMIKDDTTDKYQCRLKERCCFWCDYKMKFIEELTFTEHVNLVHSRWKIKISFYFSFLALIISIITLIIKIFEN